MIITINLESPDKLGREVWKFYGQEEIGECRKIPVKVIFPKFAPTSTPKYARDAFLAELAKRIAFDR